MCIFATHNRDSDTKRKIIYTTMKQTLYLLLGIALLASCAGGNGDGEVGNTSETPTMQGDTITVPPTCAIHAKLMCDTAGEELHSITLATTGVVTAIPNKYAAVAAPFPGRVVKTMVHIGQTVKAGSPLFELSSSDYSEVVKNYIQSRTAMETAKRTLDRTQDLYNNKVASERELDEARMNYQLALEEYRHATAVGKEYQIDLGTAEVGQPMSVRSPIAGKVLSNELVVGEYMKEDAEAKVVVADLDKVWVRANVSETAAPYVEGIEEVEVRLVSRPDSVVRGRVAYVGGLLDPETRTVQTIIECDNPGHQMLPNMYASVSMRMKEQNNIVVHKEAVLQGDGGRYVLRRVDEDRYVRTPVKVQTLDEEHLLVTEGLNVGDVFINEGAFYLIDIK